MKESFISSDPGRWHGESSRTPHTPTLTPAQEKRLGQPRNPTRTATAVRQRIDARHRALIAEYIDGGALARELIESVKSDTGLFVLLGLGCESTMKPMGFSVAAAESFATLDGFIVRVLDWFNATAVQVELRGNADEWAPSEYWRKALTSTVRVLAPDGHPDERWSQLADLEWDTVAEDEEFQRDTEAAESAMAAAGCDGDCARGDCPCARGEGCAALATAPAAPGPAAA